MLTNMKTVLIPALVLFALPVVGYAQNERGGDVQFLADQEGITINAENIPLSQLIKLLSIKGQVNITSSGPLDGTVCVNLYNVTIEQVLDAVLTPGGYGYRELDGIYLVMRTDELLALEAPAKTMEVRLFQLSYLNLDEAEQFIQPLLSEQGLLVVGQKPSKGIAGSSGDGASSSGGSSDTEGNSSAAYNRILVKDFPEVIAVIEGALSELDVRPRQVLLEATVLEVILDDSSKLGVDFNALGGLSFTELNGTSNLFSVDIDDATASQFAGGAWGGRDTGFAADDPEKGFSFGWLNDKVGIFIEALENVVDTNVISNPKIIALNRQKAEIIVGGRLGYYGTEIVNDGISQQSVEFLKTGTQLRFRPFITNDGHVRLEVNPQRSSGSIDVLTGLPSEQTSEVVTNIMIKDGDTVVIGGLIEERDEIKISRVPLLGTLPLIGWLFRSEENRTQRTEIIVLITPHILDPTLGDKDGEIEVEEFHRRKELFRESFLFCSRTLIAGRHLKEARFDLQERDLGWARYHLWRAAKLDPLNDEVYRLGLRLDEATKAEESMESYLREEIQ